MSVILAALALAAATLTPTVKATVPPVAQGATTAPITGFRSAQFRMSPGAVRHAIASDFPGARIVERIQPSEGTTVLQIAVDTLDPGPGEATVSYVFGATTRTLAQVSVVWATRGPATPDERQAIAVAGLRLSGYFRSSITPRTVLPPKIIQPGTVSLYGALDASGAGIELIASGIAYATKGTPAAPPVGPAALRLSYMANPANPDVRAGPAPSAQQAGAR